MESHPLQQQQRMGHPRSVSIALDACFLTRPSGAFQQGGLLVFEILAKKFLNIVLNQIEIMQHNGRWRVPILSCEKQWNVAKAWMGHARRPEHDIIASQASSSKLFLLFLEVLRVLWWR